MRKKKGNEGRINRKMESEVQIREQKEGGKGRKRKRGRAEGQCEEKEGKRKGSGCRELPRRRVGHEEVGCQGNY
jgi:hypothetical protein